ncbi:MAG: hypothetical protein ABL907_01230 [Hyphomicrobium sp.]
MAVGPEFESERVEAEPMHPNQLQVCLDRLATTARSALSRKSAAGVSNSYGTVSTERCTHIADVESGRRNHCHQAGLFKRTRPEQLVRQYGEDLPAGMALMPQQQRRARRGPANWTANCLPRDIDCDHLASVRRGRMVDPRAGVHSAGTLQGKQRQDSISLLARRAKIAAS